MKKDLQSLEKLYTVKKHEYVYTLVKSEWLSILPPVISIKSRTKCPQ